MAESPYPVDDEQQLYRAFVDQRMRRAATEQILWSKVWITFVEWYSISSPGTWPPLRSVIKRNLETILGPSSRHGQYDACWTGVQLVAS